MLLLFFAALVAADRYCVPNVHDMAACPFPNAHDHWIVIYKKPGDLFSMYSEESHIARSQEEALQWINQEFAHIPDYFIALVHAKVQPLTSSVTETVKMERVVSTTHSWGTLPTSPSLAAE